MLSSRQAYCHPERSDERFPISNLRAMLVLLKEFQGENWNSRGERKGCGERFYWKTPRSLRVLQENLTAQGVHDGDGGDVDDVAHGGAGLEDVHRGTHAE